LISSSALSVKSLNLPTPFSSMVPQGLLFVFLFPNNRVKTFIIFFAGAIVSFSTLTGKIAVLQAVVARIKIIPAIRIVFSFIVTINRCIHSFS
jgi:uncharacterized membrane protein YecN with MAPEG domain